MERKRNKKVAVVQCSGGSKGTVEVPGEGDCRQIMDKYPEGILDCKWGCLGRGSCVAACRLGAISINSNGAAEVDRSKCVGCGICVKACPKGLIRLTTPEYTIYPACLNGDTGAQTRKSCSMGCIACGICVKTCPTDAIRIESIHAVIDEEKCIACGMCLVHCPRGTIRDAGGIYYN